MRYHTHYSRHELEKLTHSPEGHRVGWELCANMNGVTWAWANPVRDRRGEILYCEFIRLASEEERAVLSHLLKGDLVMRYQGVKNRSTHNAWAFACLD